VGAPSRTGQVSSRLDLEKVKFAVVKIERDYCNRSAGRIYRRSHNPAKATKESSCIPNWRGRFSLLLRRPIEKPIGRGQAPTARECIPVSGLITPVSEGVLMDWNQYWRQQVRTVLSTAGRQRVRALREGDLPSGETCIKTSSET